MNLERLLQIILGPHLSEKTQVLQDKFNTYVFKVACDATKPEIKQVVEKFFKTKVTGVRVVNNKPIAKRFRGVKGSTKKWKKAYVTLAAGMNLKNDQVAVAENP